MRDDRHPRHRSGFEPISQRSAVNNRFMNTLHLWLSRSLVGVLIHLRHIIQANAHLPEGMCSCVYVCVLEIISQDNYSITDCMSNLHQTIVCDPGGWPQKTVDTLRKQHQSICIIVLVIAAIYLNYHDEYVCSRGCTCGSCTYTITVRTQLQKVDTRKWRRLVNDTSQKLLPTRRR
jgi:hypothetical protein